MLVLRNIFPYSEMVRVSTNLIIGLEFESGNVAVFNGRDLLSYGPSQECNRVDTEPSSSLDSNSIELFFFRCSKLDSKNSRATRTQQSSNKLKILINNYTRIRLRFFFFFFFRCSKLDLKNSCTTRI